MQLTLQDGGANDADRLADARLHDPGGVAVDAPAVADGDVAPLGAVDGNVTVADALVVLRAALGLLPQTPELLQHGDVAPLDSRGRPDPDQALTIADALLVLRKALGLVEF